jgi:hypothetical protein
MESEFLESLATSDKLGPGSVSWDANFEYPAHAKADIHIQSGGYCGRALAGLKPRDG